MPQGRYGFTSGGAYDAVQEFLVQREMANRQRMIDELLAQRQAADIDQRQQDLMLRAERLRQQSERQARQDAQAEEERQRERSERENARGMRLFTADAMRVPGVLDNRDTMRALAADVYGETGQIPGILAPAFQAPERTVVQTVDERGRPIRRAVTEDELAAGVPEYRAPERPDYEWVVRGGQPMQIRKGTARAGDVPYDEVAARGGGGSDYGRFLSRWATDRGLDVDRLTSQQELEARRRYMEAGRDPLFGFDNGDDGLPSAVPSAVGGGRAAGPGAVGGARTATGADVAAVAQRLDVSAAEAQKQLEARGVRVVR